VSDFPWDVISDGHRMGLRIIRWELCAHCGRGHVEIEEYGEFVRITNSDGSHILHKR
jgi:hypothetical protein